jgi:alpha-tubulin suppressor-like RCC1 family protein
MGTSSSKPSLASIPFLFFVLDQFVPGDVKKIIMRRMHALSSISSISCGSFQTMALLKNGDVYTWGSNADGQLGLGATHGSKLESLVPRKFGLEGVAAICCGGYHSMALAKDGVIYAWGANHHGQLGNGFVAAKVTRPQRIQRLARHHFCALACGQYHSLGLTTEGKVYAWGLNESGQLGNGMRDDADDEEQLWEDVSPQRVPLSHVISISCGGFHSLALTREGKLYAWGLNDSGQLGIGKTSDDTKTLTPHVIALEHVAMSCGELHSMALTRDGKVYAWGNNDEG